MALVGVSVSLCETPEEERGRTAEGRGEEDRALLAPIRKRREAEEGAERRAAERSAAMLTEEMGSEERGARERGKWKSVNRECVKETVGMDQGCFCNGQLL